MDQATMLDLPRELAENLILRWGQAEDAEALAEFNVLIHSDDPPEREEWLGHWTRDLLSGIHPTVTAQDVTVVVEGASGEIVSSVVLIPQTWSFAGIPLEIGRPELIGTAEAYRRQGLIRAQMEVVHALSAQKGHLLQAITGIPWYYRMFGYEMALNLGGGREFLWSRRGNDKPLDQEIYTMRMASLQDIPVLQALYRRSCAGSLIVQERTEAIWRYYLQDAHRETISGKQVYLIAGEDGRDIAYIEQRDFGGNHFTIFEFGVAQGHSWRSAALFVARALKRKADELNKQREKQIVSIDFQLGETHPVYDALGRQLEKPRKPYAWYVRVPDLPRFINQISPALEARLADSVLAGHTGTLRLNFYRDTLQLAFENGALTGVGRYAAKDVQDGDVMFPDLTFYQLLFGRRSFAELDAAFADCYAPGAEAAVLIDVLFPRQPSDVAPLN